MLRAAAPSSPHTYPVSLLPLPGLQAPEGSRCPPSLSAGSEQIHPHSAMKTPGKSFEEMWCDPQQNQRKKFHFPRLSEELLGWLFLFCVVLVIFQNRRSHPFVRTNGTTVLVLTPAVEGTPEHWWPSWAFRVGAALRSDTVWWVSFPADGRRNGGPGSCP